MNHQGFRCSLHITVSAPTGAAVNMIMDKMITLPMAPFPGLHLELADDSRLRPGIQLKEVHYRCATDDWLIASELEAETEIQLLAHTSRFLDSTPTLGIIDAEGPEGENNQEGRGFDKLMELVEGEPLALPTVPDIWDRVAEAVGISRSAMLSA